MAHSHLCSVYRPQFGLLTDLYQLTMAAGYYRSGLHRRRAIFHLFYRKPPFGGHFALAAGLPLAVDLIENLRFSADDVQYLGRLKGADGQPLFREPFLNYLQRLRFSGEVFAVPEGEIALPHEPLLRIEAPLAEAQLLETALLTVMNFSTLIATKAARIRAAAGEDTVLEFGLRRAQGIDGGLTASRAAYIGGCDASSNVWAGRYYGIPVRGTHAHSWVMSFPDEVSAFEAYADAMPGNAILLVDTYDTVAGVRNAIRVGHRLRERGHALLGVRLDSGDLADLSIRVRKMLDEAGLPEVRIVASDSLDEAAILDLKARGARIDIWGIGTNLVTARDQPALGGVYKLAALQNAAGKWEPKVKRSDSPIKTSDPGRLRVTRHYAEDGRPLASIMLDSLQDPPAEPYSLIQRNGLARTTGMGLNGPGQVPGNAGKSHDLLVPVFRNGELVAELPQLSETRQRARHNWQLWSGIKDFDRDFAYGQSPELYRQKLELLRRR